MDTKINKNFSNIALFSLFFIGNAVINLPFSDSIKGALPGFLIAFIASIPFILQIRKINLPAEKNVLNISINVLFLIYALFCGIVTLRNYVTFSDKIILPEIGSFFPSLLFLLLLWLICREKDSVLLKLSLISAFLVFAIVLVLFLLSFNNFSFGQLIPKELPSFKEIGYQAISYIAMSFIEGIVIIGFLNLRTNKSILGGFFWGAAILFLIILQVVAVFGYSALSNIKHPYASAMSVITFGDKFSRMEGFSYLLYFSCTLIKTAVCIKSARNCVNRIFPKANKYFMPVVLSIYGALCIFTDIFTNLPFMNIAPFLLLPPIIMLVLIKISKA